MNLNFAPMEQMMEKEHDETFNFGLNHQNIVSSSSSSSASCRIFFNPTQDHMEFYHPQDEYYGYHGSYEMENKIENGLKLSPWKKEDEEGAAPAPPQINGVKWINSSKQDHVAAKIEVKKVVIPSSSVETHLSSSYNCNSPIRVCSDCHTTKTPLWRSGPKGPKSLCNACGIRQRKARRAMAAAASCGGVASTSPPRATKVKEKMGKPSQLKKRCNLSAAGGSSNGSGKKKKKKMGNFEDFLINWSNKLAIHRVFPQDEKEAAILLMALSSGLVHG